MTPSEFVADLRAHGHEVTVSGADLVIRPKPTPEQEAYIRANALAVADAARAPRPQPQESEALVLSLDVDEIVERKRRSEEEALASEIPPARQSRTLFRTVSGGLVPLRSLSAEDVQRLRRNGSIDDDETRTWLSGRGRAAARNGAL